MIVLGLKNKKGEELLHLLSLLFWKGVSRCLNASHSSKHAKACCEGGLAFNGVCTLLNVESKRANQGEL